MFPNIPYTKLFNTKDEHIGYKLSIDMFDNGFIYSKMTKAQTTILNDELLN